jgi:hypothetical protein
LQTLEKARPTGQVDFIVGLFVSPFHFKGHLSIPFISYFLRLGGCMYYSPPRFDFSVPMLIFKV